MKPLSMLMLVLLLLLVGSPVYADDGGTGIWITLWQPATPMGLILLYGAFCALWAQNTGRNAWLWFFLGILFSVISLAVLLAKNGEDRRVGTGSR